MKVKQLIDQLQSYDLESEVVLFCEDDGLKVKEAPASVFIVRGIEQASVTRVRLPDGDKPGISFDNGKLAENLTLIRITTDD